MEIPHRWSGNSVFRLTSLRWHYPNQVSGMISALTAPRAFVSVKIGKYLRTGLRSALVGEILSQFLSISTLKIGGEESTF
jgi:hypothetical protein